MPKDFEPVKSTNEIADEIPAMQLESLFRDMPAVFTLLSSPQTESISHLAGVTELSAFGMQILATLSGRLS